METLTINVQEKKSTLVKQLLKELGVTIQNKTKARQLAQEINKSIKPGVKPSLDEIVAEVRQLRSTDKSETMNTDYVTQDAEINEEELELLHRAENDKKNG